MFGDMVKILRDIQEDYTGLLLIVIIHLLFANLVMLCRIYTTQKKWQVSAGTFLKVYSINFVL